VTTWILLRAAGIGAYVALFLSVAWGLAGSASLTPRWVSKPAANVFHAAVGSTGLVLLVVHLALLLVHRFVPFDLLDLLIPMRSSFRPVAIALGVLSMYAMVAVAVTSWLRRRVGSVWWRRTHLLAIPSFALSLLHGLLAGTDSRQAWMLALYGVSAAVVLFLIVVRSLTVRVLGRRGSVGAPQPAPDADTARGSASAA
jgi:methionine sulfoxide reductase heme-binding subunit